MRAKINCIKFVKLLVAVLITFSLVCFIRSDAAGGIEANRMNVVFVLDRSGSMDQTDPNELRFDATDLFLGLAADTGNYMGAVVFDHNIVLKRDIERIDGNTMKLDLSKAIKIKPQRGWTNIGLALETAANMLEEESNPEIPSVIILLSDGNTELNTDAEMDASKISMQNGINKAAANGYKVYSVFLNTDGNGDITELQRISDTTGGKCMEVSTAKDLKDVFSEFYSLIYSAETTTLANTTLGTNGELDVPFTIPQVGVEEANIIINTVNKDTSYSLYKPGNVMFGDSELESMTLHAKTFAIIKIPSPEAGDWKLHVVGIPEDQIRVDMVYNVSLSIEIEASPEIHDLGVGENMTFNAILYNEVGAVTDQGTYSSNNFFMHVVNTTTGEENDIPMSAGSGCATGVFTPDKTGIYEVSATVDIENMNLHSAAYRPINVDNTAPVVNQDVIEIKGNVSKLDKSIIREEDLSKYVSDKEDPVLNFSVDNGNTTADPSLVKINDQILELELVGMNEEEYISVIAQDSKGAKAILNVHVILTFGLPLWLKILLPILALLLIAVIVIILVKNGLGPVVIRGRFYAVAFNEDGEGTPATFDGTKGKMLLSRYVDRDIESGVQLNKLYVKGIKGDANSVFLISANGLYSSENPEIRQKKIRLYSDSEMTVSNNVDMQRGLRITYMANGDDDY